MTSRIIVLVLAIVLLYLGLFRYKTGLLPVSVTGLLAAGAMAVLDWNLGKMYFSEMMLFDNFAVAFSVLMILTTLLIFGFSRNYFEQISRNVAEYYALLLFALAGGIVMVSFRSEEHTSELQSLMRISYAVFCLKKKSIY